MDIETIKAIGEYVVTPLCITAGVIALFWSTR